MKKVISLVVVLSLAYSTNAIAGGSKGSDPLKSDGIIVFEGGSKGSDPSRGGSKGSDPSRGGSKGSDPSRGGSKGSDPQSQTLTNDSGYPTLMTLLRKYFSI